MRACGISSLAPIVMAGSLMSEIPRRFLWALIALVYAVGQTGPAAFAAFGFPDPPEIPFQNGVIDVGRSYTVLAGGGMEGLAADEEIVDVSLTAWIGEDSCGDRDDARWPIGPIILNAQASANGSQEPFISRSVFVSGDFAGKLLCIDQGLGIVDSTQNDYFRVWGPVAVYLLRPLPEPAEPAAEPEPVVPPVAEEQSPPVEAQPVPPPVQDEPETLDNPPAETSDPDRDPTTMEQLPPPSTTGGAAEENSSDIAVDIGSEGLAISSVSTSSGEVVIDGEVYQAVSTGGPIEQGAAVTVVAIADETLVVQHTSPTTIGAGSWWLVAALTTGALVVVASGVWLVARWIKRRHAEGSRSEDEHSEQPITR